MSHCILDFGLLLSCQRSSSLTCILCVCVLQTLLVICNGAACKFKIEEDAEVGPKSIEFTPFQVQPIVSYSLLGD